MLTTPDFLVVFCRAHAGHLPEELGEIVPVLDADQIGDLRKRQVRCGDELLCVVDAQNVEIGEHRRAGQRGKYAVEVVEIRLKQLPNLRARQVLGIVLVQIAQELLRGHIGLAELFSFGTVLREQMLMRRLKKKAVQQCGGSALVVLLAAVIAFHGSAELCLELSACQVELLRKICCGRGGVDGLEVVADEAFPALFRELRNGLPVVSRPAHIRVGKMGVIIVAGGALVALVGQPRLQKEKVPRCQVVTDAVFLQIQIPVPDHVQNPFVDAAGKVDPRLIVANLTQHSHLRKQVCIVGNQHIIPP